MISAGSATPLFNNRNRDQSDNLMTAINAVNAKSGQGMIVRASASIRRKWQMKFAMKLPQYTTLIAEISHVLANSDPAHL